MLRRRKLLIIGIFGVLSILKHEYIVELNFGNTLKHADKTMLTF